ncbi:MAG: SAM-dependent DNA methyltransferase [Solirubrobacterales bacterium]|nr:SAM-dependent DNA methyltransferase [Solirubrobacterales bacterium]
MTPRQVAEALLDRVDLRPGMRVLDPGVGTGELLRATLDREPGIETIGWDVDETAIAAAGELVPEAELEVRSALEAGEPGDGGFDLVIANPPYFQLRLDPSEKSRFARVISGRANIFALFFQVGIELLKPGGRLAFIVPPSMNSGAYFEGLREFLTESAEVVDLTLLEGTDIFEGANTAVQLLVLRKHGNEVGRIFGTGTENPTHRKFVFRREVPGAGFRRVLFSPDPARLAAEFEGRMTLWELGLEAFTGPVIWNENRDRLADGPGPGRVPLIWSRSIGAEGLLTGLSRSAGKAGYYDTKAGGREPLTGPAIVVNRVVGAVGRGELRAALVPEGLEFLAENHVNVIRRREPGENGGDFPGWEAVLDSLRRPGVAERVRLLTGNTQISARELTHLLPLE